MKQIFLILCALVIGNISARSSSPQAAERIVKESRLAQLEWEQRMLVARTTDEKLASAKLRPKYSTYSAKMISEIRPSLHQKWAMPYIIWLLNNHTQLSQSSTKDLLGWVEKYHMDSPLLGEFCVALAPAGKNTSQPSANNGINKVVNITADKVSFIESIINSNRPKTLRGQACLALSGVIASMGDSPEINRRRLDLIRKAIINAADSRIGGVTIAEMAKEEIYRMTKLSKNAQAPELIGRDSSSRTMKLSDFKGKVVVLVFWTSWEQPIKVLDYLRKTEKSFSGKNVQILGINRDTFSNLREIEIAEKTSGKNFSDPNGELFHIYRVTDSPLCYVLDEKGVIQYNGPLGSFVDLTVSALLSPTPQR